MISAPSALDLVDALLLWTSDGSAANCARVASALGNAAQATRLAGARLELELAGRTPLAIGWGTLEAAPATGAAALDLHAADGTPITGRVWFDGTPADPSLVRAIELAAGASASRVDLQLATDRLAGLEAATRGIVGLLALDDALQLIVDRVRDLLKADYAALGIVDDLGVIERFVTSGISEAERARIGAPPVGRGLLGLVVRDNRAYRVDDIAAHPASAGFPAAHPAMAAFLGVPIHVRGRSVGNLYLTNRPGGPSFSEDDEHLVETFAIHAGIAIENARLQEQLRRVAVSDERERIGRDLHDGIIQSIYAVSLSLEDVPELIESDAPAAADCVDRAIDALNVTIRDLRNFIFGLHADPQEQQTLADGLATLAREVRVNSLIDVEVDVDIDDADLAMDERSEILMIVREALANVVRHSRAARVRISVAETGDGYQLTIMDDGRGFILDGGASAPHHGLPTMRTRAQRLGGTLRVESGPSVGTSVILGVPHRVWPATEHRAGGVP